MVIFEKSNNIRIRIWSSKHYSLTSDAEETFSVVFDGTCYQEVWTAPEKASHAKEQLKSWKRGES